METVKAVQNLGIKVVLDLGNWDEGYIIDAVAEDPKLRTILSKEAADLVDKYNADGICLFWIWPRCPKVRRIHPTQDKRTLKPAAATQ
jgi:GH18 family chitinase